MSPESDGEITAVQAGRMMRQLQVVLAAVEESRRRQERLSDRQSRMLRLVVTFAAFSIVADGIGIVIMVAVVLSWP